MKRLLSHNSDSGISEWFDYDDQTDTTTISMTQDVSGFIENNKTLYNADDNGWFSKSKEMRRAATIPDAVILKWIREEGINVFDPSHWPKVKAKLNDREYLYLRTAPGKL